MLPESDVAARTRLRTAFGRNCPGLGIERDQSGPQAKRPLDIDANGVGGSG
jgi:hypothetical protein